MKVDKPCTNNTPPWFVGHWRDWHRGHGCDRDDGKPRTEDARTEVAQHEANAGTGFLTDAELRFLRASTTSGNERLCRALDELAARRAVSKLEERARADCLADAELLILRAATPGNELIVRALDELAARRVAERWNTPLRRGLAHCMTGPLGYRCSCGTAFDDYYGLAEHVRQSIDCPRCGASPTDLGDDDLYRWRCGHWIARGDASAKIRGDASGDVEESPAC